MTNEEANDILDKISAEVHRQMRQVNPNFSADWNEGFDDGMIHVVASIIPQYIKGE